MALPLFKGDKLSKLIPEECSLDGLLPVCLLDICLGGVHRHTEQLVIGCMLPALRRRPAHPKHISKCSRQCSRQGFSVADNGAEGQKTRRDPSGCAADMSDPDNAFHVRDKATRALYVGAKKGLVPNDACPDKRQA